MPQGTIFNVPIASSKHEWFGTVRNNFQIPRRRKFVYMVKAFYRFDKLSLKNVRETKTSQPRLQLLRELSLKLPRFRR